MGLSYLAADIPLDDGKMGKLAHPLEQGTWDEVLRVWRRLAPYLPTAAWYVTDRRGLDADQRGRSAAGGAKEARAEGGEESPEEGSAEPSRGEHERRAAV